MKTAVQTLFACICLAFLFANCDFGSPKNCAASGTTIPDTLKVGPTDVLAFKLRATGFQVYKCEGGKWVGQAPTAKLFDEQDAIVGTHFGGPSWQATLKNDTSKVVGTVKVKIASTSTGAIDWILLDAKSSGEGMFAGVSKIQRLETNGGRTPDGTVDSLWNGTMIRMPYTATYYFYKPK